MRISVILLEEKNINIIETKHDDENTKPKKAKKETKIVDFKNMHKNKNKKKRK